jgi:hypothetical protein
VSDELERALRDLGTRLDVPEAPDVTATVLSRLDERPRARWRPAHRVVAAALAALVALATAMVVSPAVRAAVYDLLRIGGVEIHENRPAPTSPSTDPPLPGERDVSLAQARELADFPLRLPRGLGEPTNVRVIGDDKDEARVVSMAFASPHGEVRVDQFNGGLSPMFSKFASGAGVHHVTVSGLAAVWVDGPHVVIYDDPDGTMREESARLAGSTLIWERDGTTYRVEGSLTQGQAVEIAESLS